MGYSMICKDTKSFSKIRLLAKIKDSLNHPKYKLCTMLTLLKVNLLRLIKIIFLGDFHLFRVFYREIT